jgi:cyclopropane fatty-acyl-phospholipid synthase-like methyltransferase
VGARPEALALEPADLLLDVGCGGGIFLRQALETGCTAIGVDHSRDMVLLAREKNAGAIAAGPLATGCHFYEDDELAARAHDAGFDDVAVSRSEEGAQLLVGRR